MSNVSNNEFMANNEMISKLRNTQLKIIVVSIVVLPVLLIFTNFLVTGIVFALVLGTCFHYNNEIKDYTKRNADLHKKAYPDPNTLIQNSMSSEGEEFQTQEYSNQSYMEAPKSRFGQIESPSDNDTNLEIIISPEVEEDINKGIGKINHREFLYKQWNLKSIDKMDGKNIFNFYGPPGTGKTISAKKVAKILDKKLFVVKYDQVESKMVGETEKNISSVFKFAKENKCIIFLDEADALVSQRVESISSNAQHLNAVKNVFMQELDRFNGIMILTTNNFHSFDPALLRRISQHIAFELPNQEMRLKLFRSHIPKEVNLDSNVDFNKLALISNGLSGGDIKNITVEAMTNAINQADQLGDITKACLTEAHLMNEIKKVKKTKKAYFNEMDVKTIGISQSDKD